MASEYSLTTVAGLGGSRKRSERMAAILDLIPEDEEIGLRELASQLSASPATIRRDLAMLAEHRFITRTHGGARISAHTVEMPVALRDTRFQEAKKRIARAAALRVPAERYAVALSGGTTATYVARELSNRTDLTIVTNSLSIASLVSAYPRLRVAMTGGLLRPQSLELVGILAERTFTAVNVELAILGADGVSVEAGLTTHDETEARTNNAMVRHAPRAMVVADGSKIGRAALAQMATVDEIATLVTDESADPDEVERLRAHGVEVIVVPTR